MTAALQSSFKSLPLYPSVLRRAVDLEARIKLLPAQ